MELFRAENRKELTSTTKASQHVLLFLSSVKTQMSIRLFVCFFGCFLKSTFCTWHLLNRICETASKNIPLKIDIHIPEIMVHVLNLRTMLYL